MSFSIFNIIKHKWILSTTLLLMLVGYESQIAIGQTMALSDSIDATTHAFDEYPLISTFYVRKPYSQEMVLFSWWNQGDIYFENGYILNNIMISYDRLDDILVWMRDIDFKMGIVNKELVRGFTLTDEKTGQLYHFEKNNDLIPWAKDVYLQVLSDGYMTVRVWRQYLTSPEIRVNDKFYVTIDTITNRFHLNRASFISNMGLHKKEMRQIIRKNNLKISSNEADLIKAVELFNAKRRED